MATILVTGSKGQVGNEIQYLDKSFSNLNFIYVDVDDLDITDPAAVVDFFRANKIDYCINCAAYTAVDKAESSKEVAYAVNVTGVRNLAQGCLLHKAPLIQLSTDYVYHNSQNTPFKETDTTNPQSVYASTKLEGDEMALKINPLNMVLRTSWVYSSFGHNFVKTMIRLGTERDDLGIVFDQIGTPTYARDLAHAMLSIIDMVEKEEIDQSKLQGIFHYSNEGVTSWYDFAKAIFEMENIDCNTRPIETSEYPTPAKRPPFSVLNKNKIKNTFGIQIPHWRPALKACLSEIKKNKG